jgi:hypothetical protein
MAAEPLRCPSGLALIVGGDLMPLLGIELRGNFRRADQIAEQDGQVAPLSVR